MNPEAPKPVVIENKPENRDTLRAEYYSLLERRKKVNARLGYLMQHASPDNDLLLSLDKEKHDVHVRAQEVGQKLGKTLTEMDLDVMMMDGNAEDFGLEAPIIFPENEPAYRRYSETLFEVMKLVEDVGDNPDKLSLFRERLRKYKNQVYPKARADLPLWTPGETNLQLDVLMKTNKPSGYFPPVDILADNHPILPNEVVLIYGVERFTYADQEGKVGYDYDCHQQSVFSANFSKRIGGLVNLTEDFPANVRMFASGGLAFHGSHRVYGVAVDRDRLVEIVKKIKGNRSKYWTTIHDDRDARETVCVDPDFSDPNIEYVEPAEKKAIPLYLRRGMDYSVSTDQEKQLVKQYWRQEIQRLFELYKGQDEMSLR